VSVRIRRALLGRVNRPGAPGLAANDDVPQAGHGGRALHSPPFRWGGRTGQADRLRLESEWGASAPAEHVLRPPSSAVDGEAAERLPRVGTTAFPRGHVAQLVRAPP
jgi:hypothetical protein